MRRVLPTSVLEEVGALDPAAIAQVQQEAWPDVRDADELHDALLTLIALPETQAGPQNPMDVIPSEGARPSRGTPTAPVAPLVQQGIPITSAEHERNTGAQGNE